MLDSWRSQGKPVYFTRSNGSSVVHRRLSVVGNPHRSRAMLADLLVNALGQLLGEVTGESIGALLDRRALERGLAAVVRAEQRFAREYRAHDAELTDALAAGAHPATRSPAPLAQPAAAQLHPLRRSPGRAGTLDSAAAAASTQ